MSGCISNLKLWGRVPVEKSKMADVVPCQSLTKRHGTCDAKCQNWQKLVNCQYVELAKINNKIKDLKDVVTSWIICLLVFSDDDFNLWCNVPELYFY